MAKKHIVKCRLCKQPFEAQPEGEGIIWVMPSKNWYYHKNCYDNWIKNVGDNVDEKDWPKYIYDFLKHTVQLDYDWYLCEAQRKKMLKENNFTNKGIYFALRYFYEIKHGDKEKSHGGIGIVPYIYGESAQYWIDREKKNKGTIENIIKQMKIFDSPEITVKVNKPKLQNKRKENVDWDNIDYSQFED